MDKYEYHDWLMENKPLLFESLENASKVLACNVIDLIEKYDIRKKYPETVV
jgi:hypothetical protein